MPTLLAIDDDPLVLKCFEFAFPPTVTVRTVATGELALKSFHADTPDVVISDVRLPDMSGLDLLAKLREKDARVPVILMTGHGTAETAIEAMRRGAYDYLLKPFDPDSLVDVVKRAIEISRLMRVPAVVPTEPSELTADPKAERDLFIGHSAAMQEVYKAIGRVAPTNATVLIRGESGTGKEMVARAIYHYSNRRSKPFLALNCAAIPETLLESELFGHERGSFTGADRRRIGKFEQCDGGTIFLDEIGDMSLLAQAKVLRVLQDQQFERVGGNEPVRADCRVIAATHRDLESMITEGKFREDLFYRLNVCPISLPPLRERLEDIEPLVEHFTQVYAREFDKSVRGVSPEVISILRAGPWPGNVRQLQSVIKQALLRSVGPILTADCLPELRRANAVPHADDGPNVARLVADALRDGEPNLLERVHAHVERFVIARALEHTNGNISQAAQILGIARPTLRTKLAQLGLHVESTVRSDRGI